MSDELHQLPCIVCDQPMRQVSGPRITWEGDYGFTRFLFECPNACQTTADVAYRQYIPIDVARLQP